MRIILSALFLQRNTAHQARARAGSTIDAERSAEQFYALIYAGQAKMLRLRAGTSLRIQRFSDLEAAPVVVDIEAELIFFQYQAQSDMVGGGMFAHICERFLSDAVEGGLDARGNQGKLL